MCTSQRNTSPLSCSHCTGSLSPNGLSTKSSVSHIEVYKKQHHSIYRNSFANIIHPVLSAPLPCTDWASLDLARTQTKKQQQQKKTFSSKVIPQCCFHPPEQAARQVLPSERHGFFLAAAEITFVFNYVIPSSPCPYSLPLVLLLLSNISIFWILCSEHVVFLNGVRLSSKSGQTLTFGLFTFKVTRQWSGVVFFSFDCEYAVSMCISCSLYMSG